jgi:hypothetical protein
MAIHNVPVQCNIYIFAKIESSSTTTVGAGERVSSVPIDIKRKPGMRYRRNVKVTIGHLRALPNVLKRPMPLA